MTFEITVTDAPVQAALQALANRVTEAQPFLQAVGDDIVERSKERFSTSTGPDGQPWKPNAASTLQRYLAKTKGNFKKDGSLSKKGATRQAGKKPLIGESKFLSREIFAQAAPNSVTVGAVALYAAIQQFGGKKSEFANLWGDIPARPFLPIKPDGSIYPTELGLIIDQLNRYLAADL